MLLFCQLCLAGKECYGDPPRKCPNPACNRETRWTTCPPGATRVDGWVPSFNDRRFLRGLRVYPE